MTNVYQPQPGASGGIGSWVTDPVAGSQPPTSPARHRHDGQDIDPGTVTSTQIKDGSIAAADLAAGSVTSAKIMDGSLVRMLDSGFALSGSPPVISDSSAPLRLQAGTLVATTGVSGNVALTFPTAFANGLLTVVACQGDITVTDAIVDTQGGNVNGVTLYAFHGNGTACNGLLVRFNWIAIGW